MRDINFNIAGRYRIGDVYTYIEQPDTTVKRHYYLEWEKISKEMEELLNREIKDLRDIILFKLDFSQIHPFNDSNGRISRLVLNWLLINLDYPPITIKGDTKESRDKYISAMALYSGQGDMESFENLVLDELVQTINKFID